MEALISVIVPVYNCIGYLPEAVDSILAQTYQRLEVILVDDGSQDGSGALCDEYAAKESRVRAIHQPNRGLTAAWKRGVEEAGGEYVGFVDADDWIDADMYEVMYRHAVREGADIVCCGIRHVFEGNTHKPWDDVMALPRKIYTKEQIHTELFPVLINDGSFMGRGLQPNRVSKLVRRSLILQYMWLCDEGVTVGEDYQFSFSIFPEAGKVVILKDFIPYYYRVNPKSMTGGNDRDYLGKIKYMRRQLERIGRQKGVYDFGPQIRNDFLCLCVLHIKDEIVRNKKAGYRENRRNMSRILKDGDVQEALLHYDMPGLGAAERVFLFWLKKRWYAAVYLAVKLYFRDQV